MDRLARNLDDLRRLVRELTGRGVRVEFLCERLTFSAEESPMATLLLSVLGAFAEFERALIRERQAEGIALAKARGVYQGRKRSLTSAQVEDLRGRVAAGEPKASLARSSASAARRSTSTYAGQNRHRRGQDEAMANEAHLATRSDQGVWQLRAVIAGISPLIWRRLLVPTEVTIAELHAILQTVFGWGGEHLHRFTIHGREYGICYDGGPWFRDNARAVRLGDLGLRPRERLRYEYNFYAPWLVELRVEQIRPPEPGRAYPRCTGGRRAGPPEDWAGPWEFLERTRPHLVFAAMLRAAEIVARCSMPTSTTS